MLVALASANRDERTFANADGLNITRPRNRHVAFGHGVHFSLGAPLARMVGHVALGTLSHFPDLTPGCEPGQLRWRATVLLRSPSELPVVLSPELVDEVHH